MDKESRALPLTGDTDAFASHTIRCRFPQIVANVLKDNPQWPEEYRLRLSALETLYRTQPEKVALSTSDGEASWNLDVSAGETSPEMIAVSTMLDGQPVLQAPWIYVEVYFYAQLLRESGFFSHRLDPFASTKERSCLDALPAVAAIARFALEETVQPTQGRLSPSRDSTVLHTLLMYSLWANRIDLSMWTPQQLQGHEFQHRVEVQVEEETKNLLVDDSSLAIEFLLLQREVGTGGQPLLIILDNAGMELCCDLMWTHAILSKGIVHQVILHAKKLPTFVSDATPRDVELTLQWMQAQEGKELQRVAKELVEFLEAGTLRVESDWFYNSPLLYQDMPVHIRDCFQEACLVLSKGDLNYRRLVGDAHWAVDTPFSFVVNYLPEGTNLLALRTLKSCSLCGVDLEEAQRAEKEQGQGWRSCGEYAVVQFLQSIQESA